MSKMDFGEKMIACGFSMIGMLVLSLVVLMITASVRSSRYERDCIEAGGVYMSSRGGDFCVKEFLPLKKGEE